MPELNWVQCEDCKDWNLFENCGIDLPKFDAKKIEEISYKCRMCKMESHITLRYESRFEEMGKRLSNSEHELEVAREKIETVEKAIIELNVNMKAVEVESRGLQDGATKTEINKIEFEERVVKLSSEIDEIKSRMTVSEMEYAKIREEWPTPTEAPLAKNPKIAETGRELKNWIIPKLNKGSFGEKYKNKGKDTVIVQGDSLVIGIGSCLQKQSQMFDTVANPGAKIETIAEKLKVVGEKPDSHLVLMVGTNNLKVDGSEEMVAKYRNLISEAKRHKYRKISVVSIPDRADVGDFFNGRRTGVNRSLRKLCMDSGIEFLQISNVRNLLARDGLHLSPKGQDLVAREIFRHCRNYLN